MKRDFTDAEVFEALELAAKEGWMRKQWLDDKGDWGWSDPLKDLPHPFTVGDVMKLHDCTYSRAKNMVYIWVQRDIAEKVEGVVPARKQPAKYALRRSHKLSTNEVKKQ